MFTMNRTGEWSQTGDGLTTTGHQTHRERTARHLGCMDSGFRRKDGGNREIAHTQPLILSMSKDGVAPQTLFAHERGSSTGSPRTGVVTLIILVDLLLSRRIPAIDSQSSPSHVV